MTQVNRSQRTSSAMEWPAGEIDCEDDVVTDDELVERVCFEAEMRM